jgi:IclR family acetate operon transcriptional repressor
MPNDVSRTSSTAANALRLLKTLAGYPEGVGVTELAAHTGMGKSTVHLLLATLVQEGFASTVDGRYRLGLAVLGLAGAVGEREAFQGANMISLKRLALRTGESVSVAIARGRDAVIVERIESTERLRAEIRVGTPMPLFASASGKVLLAFSDPAVVTEIYPAERLPPSTERAITTKKALDRELRRVRSDGYAVSRDEFTVGVSAVAAPIYGRSGVVAAAVSVAGPTHRFDPERWAGEVAATAADMSRELGSNGTHSSRAHDESAS